MVISPWLYLELIPRPGELGYLDEPFKATPAIPTGCHLASPLLVSLASCLPASLASPLLASLACPQLARLASLLLASLALLLTLGNRGRGWGWRTMLGWYCFKKQSRFFTWRYSLISIITVTRCEACGKLANFMCSACKGAHYCTTECQVRKGVNREKNPHN